jgi:hypothetical protein
MGWRGSCGRLKAQCGNGVSGHTLGTEALFRARIPRFRRGALAHGADPAERGILSILQQRTVDGPRARRWRNAAPLCHGLRSLSFRPIGFGRYPAGAGRVRKKTASVGELPLQINDLQAACAESGCSNPVPRASREVLGLLRRTAGLSKNSGFPKEIRVVRPLAAPRTDPAYVTL